MTESTIKVPLSERINLRMLVVFGVIMLLVGYPVYTLISEEVTGGVHHSGQFYTVNLKAMGNFSFDENNGTINDVPQQWRDLDGKKLSLIGEIYAPTEASDQIHRFELVYSIAKCCFGGPPKVQERVFCAVPNNGTIQRPDGFANVKGTVHVKVKKDGNVVTSVYQLDVESVEPMQ